MSLCRDRKRAPEQHFVVRANPLISEEWIEEDVPRVAHGMWRMKRQSNRSRARIARDLPATLSAGRAWRAGTRCENVHIGRAALLQIGRRVRVDLARLAECGVDGGDHLVDGGDPVAVAIDLRAARHRGEPE